jgi:hypothetical protein
MPILTDTSCKQKYSTANTLSEVCAGETGQNKDTCQVFKIFFKKLFKVSYTKNYFARGIVAVHSSLKVKLFF